MTILLKFNPGYFIAAIIEDRFLGSCVFTSRQLFAILSLQVDNIYLQHEKGEMDRDVYHFYRPNSPYVLFCMERWG